MVKATLVVTKAYQNNRIFDMSNPVNGRDNHLYTIKLLKDELRQYNIDLSTQDVNCINESEIIIYNDIPSIFPSKSKSQKCYLLAMESIAVAPRNFDTKYYFYFDKIFTFYDDLVDGINIIKNNYSFLINPLEYIDFEKKDGFICLVSGNKYSNFNGELYTERIRLINYFENHTDYQFSLYGTDWNNCYKLKFYNFIKILQTNISLRILLKFFEKIIKLLKIQSFFIIELKNYKGKLSPKIPKLKYYKYNFCYENTYNINGYITEKLFDCFLSGCIPIYLGAPNISDYIPENTYIDKRNFKNYDDLLSYLTNITHSEYTEFQNNIKAFLISDKVLPFQSEFVVNNIVKHIISI
jgi:hypothetical protein